jgi:hypothetical protein
MIVDRIIPGRGERGMDREPLLDDTFRGTKGVCLAVKNEWRVF